MQGVDEAEWRAAQSLFEELVDLALDEQDRRLIKSKLPPHIVHQVAALLLASRSEGILDMASPSMDHGSGKTTTYTSLPKGAEVGGFETDALR